MEHESDWERIARYAAGQCSPDEAIETQRWIEADPARRALAAQLGTIWANADLTPTGWDSAAAWTALEARLDGMPRASALTRRIRTTTLWPDRKPTVRWNLRLAAAAAAVALALGAGVAYRQLRARAEPSTSPVALRDYVTPRGQRADFNLADGTHVLLGVASRLRVPADYGARDRQVYLEGEAYFEVRQDRARPFVVRTGGTVTQDIGTRFVVRAYSDDHAVQVVVAEGRVRLQGTELARGQLGRVAGAGPVTVKTGVDLDRYLAWTEGRLVFDNTPLRDALPQLDRWYDLDFRLGDSSLASLPVTATFKNQPTDEVLDLLAQTLGLRQERRGRVVTLYPARPAH
jgi:transmembrane sensor